MDFKTLVKKETREYKERMKKESQGLYMLMYIGLGFSVLFSAMFGFRYEYDDYIVLFTLCIMNGVLYECITMYIFSVREKGVRHSIFSKYSFVPVEPKKLILAKTIVTVRALCIPVMLSQLVAIMVRIINPDNDGGSIKDITVWFPIILGLLFIGIDVIQYSIRCHSAMKQ